MCGWLGGLGLKDKPAETGKLLTIEEVGEILNGESESSNPDTRDHGKMNNPTSFLSKTPILIARLRLSYFILLES